jgi:hypothetical protein
LHCTEPDGGVVPNGVRWMGGGFTGGESRFPGILAAKPAATPEKNGVEKHVPLKKPAIRQVMTHYQTELPCRANAEALADDQHSNHQPWEG